MRPITFSFCCRNHFGGHFGAPAQNDGVIFRDNLQQFCCFNALLVIPLCRF
jgi:hypothetical protein